MSNQIRIRRRTSGAPGAPASLLNGELAYNEVSDVLYYGKGLGASDVATSIIEIGGSGVFATKSYVDGALEAFDLSAYAALAGDNSFTAGHTNTFYGTLNIEGTFQIDGDPVNLSAAELNVLDGVTAGAASASKALVVDANKDINLGTGSLTAAGLSAATLSTTGNATVGGSMTVTGNLTVNGTTTTINSTVVSVDDKNVILGDVSSPTDVTADGGGITLKGATDKTLNWVASTGAWTSSEHVNLASGKAFYINGTSVLSSTTLGSTIVSSSLTSVGTITTGVWHGTAVAVGYGGTGLTAAVTGLLKGNGTSYAAAVVDTDYLAPGSVIDGGTY